jgi:CO/xanthine dehydrogenase Mo-binding subunit
LANYFDVSGGQPFERFDRLMEMKLNDDGTVVVIFNHPDGGMNLLGTLAQIAAESLGIGYDDVSFVTDSTKGKMFDIGMAANSGLYTLGNALIKTAASLKRNILAEAARQSNREAGSLDLASGAVVDKVSGEPLISLKDLAGRAVNGHGEPSRAIAAIESYQPTANPNPFGSVFVDLTVDVETGETKIKKIVLVHDIGRAINPLTVEGQLEGGVALGIGYALYEDAAIDPRTGVTRGANFDSYRLPTTFEVPEIDVVLYEEPTPSGPYGGKGVGMCGPHAIAAAVANAVYDAAGVRIRELPLTPERILEALAAANTASEARETVASL